LFSYYALAVHFLSSWLFVPGGAKVPPMIIVKEKIIFSPLTAPAPSMRYF